MPGVGDAAIADATRRGASLADIAAATCHPAASIMLRLVEIEIGPLGRVRPNAGPSRPLPGAPQPPVLALAAQAFEHGIQRLGDRYYLDGQEVTLIEIVRRARARGVRIRYPGIDPLEPALSGGPSMAHRRRRGRETSTDPLLRALTGRRP